MKPVSPPPVKLFAGLLYSDTACLERAGLILEKKFGPVDFKSRPFAFDLTDYYVPEMGKPIIRVFYSFQRLIHPGEISRIKRDTNRMEDKLAVGQNRKVNIDPGYMDYDKVVLASAKYNGQKIYLDHGIWADLTLHYQRGGFQPYPWSFPDFKTGQYNDVFMKIRALLKHQRRISDDPETNQTRRA